MAFQILHPYISQDDYILDDYTDNEEEKEPINMGDILENITKYHNNLPHKENMFRPDTVSQIAQEILDQELGNLHYSALLCRQKSKELSDKIRDAIKDLGFDRYKLVCTVSIGSLDDQGLYMASRCLWFTMTDASATAVFRNTSLFAVAIVFGIYME